MPSVATAPSARIRAAMTRSPANDLLGERRRGRSRGRKRRARGPPRASGAWRGKRAPDRAISGWRRTSAVHRAGERRGQAVDRINPGAVFFWLSMRSLFRAGLAGARSPVRRLIAENHSGPPEEVISSFCERSVGRDCHAVEAQRAQIAGETHRPERGTKSSLRSVPGPSGLFGMTSSMRARMKSIACHRRTGCAEMRGGAYWI